MTSTLDLLIEVTTADGTRYRWDADQPADSRPRNLSFSTKVGEGFSAAALQLPRRIDQDYPDLNLVDTITMFGADGSIAYEGRVSALPRELTDTHSISVQLAGWMAHAKDKKFAEIYVDRDLGAWGDMSVSRRAQLLSASISPVAPSQVADPANNQASISTAMSDTWAAPFSPASEAWYDAGSTGGVSAVAYSWKRDGTGSAAPWQWVVGISVDDAAASTVTTGNLVAAGPGSGTLTAAAQRYAFLQCLYGGTPAGTAGGHYGLFWYSLAAYGTAGLTTYSGETGQPPGVLASDAIKNIAQRWCPKLDVSGVETTTYVIQHLAFKDRMFPFDAFLEINKYHLWHLGVWEDKKLTFRPYDLTDYDWEIRTDDPGTTFTPQGVSVDDVFNGITVTYTDVLNGLTTTLTPSTNAELRDLDAENVWNRHSVDHWDEIELSSPTTRAGALNLGTAALADRNTPKTPGTIVVSGYIRDRQGNEQPVWKVRAGDTISITNFPNDAPRLIVETTYDDDQKQVSLSIDRPFALLDAYLDRVGNALGAR